MALVASISQQIWDMKYRLKGPDRASRSTRRSRTPGGAWRRRSPRPNATPRHGPSGSTRRWTDFKFLPAGRVLAGAGSGAPGHAVQLLCDGRRSPTIMGGIFAHLREAALTMQQGGGIGYDFSTLRPKGAPVKGVGADASGPLSFMDVWDAMCRTIMSAGSRRGAMMATLRCDHPDIEAFIDAKREPGRLRMFNLSVLVTDAFMAGGRREDAPWELSFGGKVYRIVPARELWDKIMRATYDYAEPGVIFIDRINRRNNLCYCETDHRDQSLRRAAAAALWRLPAGLDQPGPPGRASVHRRGAARPRPAAPRWCRDCVRMMDNVIDISRFPLPQHRQEARAEAPHRPRASPGLADALIICGLRYGSAERPWR